MLLFSFPIFWDLFLILYIQELSHESVTPKGAYFYSPFLQPKRYFIVCSLALLLFLGHTLWCLEILALCSETTSGNAGGPYGIPGIDIPDVVYQGLNWVQPFARQMALYYLSSTRRDFRKRFHKYSPANLEK